MGDHDDQTIIDKPQNRFASDTTADDTVDATASALQEKLAARYEPLREHARQHYSQYGDPIDELIKLFDGLDIDDEEWQNILDEPYR